MIEVTFICELSKHHAPDLKYKLSSRIVGLKILRWTVEQGPAISKVTATVRISETVKLRLLAALRNDTIPSRLRIL